MDPEAKLTEPWRQPRRSNNPTPGPVPEVRGIARVELQR